MSSTLEESRVAFNPQETQQLVDALVQDIKAAAEEFDGEVNSSTTTAAPQYPLLIDRNAQTTLAIRVAIYWIGCVLYFAVVLFCSQVMYNPKVGLFEHFREYVVDMIQWVPAILLLLPLVIYDMLRATQRILIPVEQVRAGLAVLATGKVPEPIPCDDEKFNHALMVTYNEIRDSVIAETVASALESRFLDSALDSDNSEESQ